MKRKPISKKIRCNILLRDGYSCMNCGFNKIYTIDDVPDFYKKNFNTFINYTSQIRNNLENNILEFKDNGGSVEDIIFNWLSPSYLELDHILAVCNGGLDEESNLRFLCKNCHRQKTHKDISLKVNNYNKSIPFLEI